MTAAWPWIAIALLGAYHGLDPSMGWLFAVALGLQERRRAKVFAALGPIAFGHLVSIATVVALIGWARFAAASRTFASGRGRDPDTRSASFAIFGRARIRDGSRCA